MVAIEILIIYWRYQTVKKISPYDDFDFKFGFYNNFDIFFLFLVSSLFQLIVLGA